MKKRSCSSHGSQKSIECPSFRKDKKLITFEYNNLQCFINSNSQSQHPPNVKNLKKERKLKTIPSHLSSSCSSQLTNPLAQLKVPRKNKGKVTNNSKNAFNNSLLLLQFQGEEEKIENKNDSSERQKESPTSEEEDQEVTQVVNSCLRVITEDTEHSSNPISARYTPQNSLTPTNMTVSMDFPMNQQHMMPQEYYYYMLKAPSVRNRRTISTEQSKDYVVDIKKVFSDGRTTIMIRNIPNKYSQDMLLELFEKNHKKKFDFFYLPIDYNNNCNVGYAFLNFIHTKFIPDFYKEFHQRKWNKFNSIKVCQVCYARIQGTAQLQHHFEHSNVLQQREKRYRPLIGLKSLQQNVCHLIQKQKDQHASESDSS